MRSVCWPTTRQAIPAIKYVDPPDVTLKNLDLTDKGSFYVSAVSNDTDESAATATFTVRLASQPTADVTIGCDEFGYDRRNGDRALEESDLQFLELECGADGDDHRGCRQSFRRGSVLCDPAHR